MWVRRWQSLVAGGLAPTNEGERYFDKEEEVE
jgi:hypothetical protein